MKENYLNGKGTTYFANILLNIRQHSKEKATLFTILIYKDPIIPCFAVFLIKAVTS